MNTELIVANKEDETIIANLLQFYIYDFSEFIGGDVNETGLFEPYAELPDYWNEGSGKFPYLIKSNGKYAGFVLVKKIESNNEGYTVAEFFILRKYRGKGVGKAIARQIFDSYPGQWEVFQRETNQPAQVFWVSVIKEYTNGQFTDHLENARRVQRFENSFVTANVK